ncbi:MAG: hypothetical protein KC501_05620 [Myxococcales bacterium]|nr:hypothetical protein [Myxococcales bacterium]
MAFPRGSNPRPGRWARLALVAALLGPGSCGRSGPPPTPPTGSDPATDGVLLRHAPTIAPLRHELELELTHTSLGLYLEAKVGLHASLSTAAEADGLRSTWTLEEAPTLELVGTVEDGDRQAVRARLSKHTSATSLADDRGVSDPDSPEPLATEGESSRAAGLLLTAVGEQLRLPRLPEAPLRLDTPVEQEEESETVLTDAGEVLPTTTVRRYTLRSVKEGVAEVAVELATVAERVPAEDEPAPAEDALRMETRAEGTLLFDLERGLPVSLELSRSEHFELGDQEVERSLLVRSRYRTP